MKLRQTFLVMLALLIATPAHALMVNFRAKFTNLSADVTQADVKAAAGTAVTVVFPNAHSAASTCPTDTANKCVDFTMQLARSDTRSFTVCVANTLNEVACSNAVVFQTPPILVAPNLNLNVLSLQ